MVLKKVIVFAVLLFILKINAQEKDEVLLTIDGEKVFTSEFVRVFQKNKDIVVDNEQKKFEDYFDMFVDFKLKIKQAKDIKLDTSSNYQSELIKYREQLILPYLQNPEATDKLVREAYERTINEVDVSHILIRVKPDAKPQDTLIAFQKITEARSKAISGIPFKQVANQYSEDPSVKTNGGNLGYFSVFSMVYTFENAASKTKIGEVSEPFRTQFGYHIIKVVDKRKSRGEVEVAHIMVKNDSSNSTYAKDKIFDIYNKLSQGADFSKIAQEHSDDLSSAKKGGKLPKFGTGRMIKPFEDIAFDFENEGDFSEPFETSYGWHILKLIKKYPIKSFDELHDNLESRIKSGSRSKYVEKALANELAKNYTISEKRDVLTLFYSYDDEEKKSDQTILIIEDKVLTANEFFIYMVKNRNKSIEESFEDFKNKKIIDYYKDHLEETNNEFAIIYQEYKDGLLLFELLQKNIWEKSEKDSLGLLHYFELNKNKYTWKKRGELIIASCTKQEKAALVKNYLLEGRSMEEIKNLVNEGATIHVLFSSGILEEGSSKLPKEYDLAEGVSEIFVEKNKQFTIIKVEKIILPENKKLDETRGEVINDYQNYLEELWVRKLREMYEIKINKKALKKLELQFADL